MSSASSWGGMDVRATGRISTAGDIREFLAKARRAPPRPLDPQVQDLSFQLVDLDYVQAPFDRTHDEPLGTGPQGDRATLRVFGVTDAGNSVCAFVHGFEPYFYAKAPDGFTDHDVREVLNCLLAWLNDSAVRVQRGAVQGWIECVSVGRRWRAAPHVGPACHVKRSTAAAGDDSDCTPVLLSARLILLTC
jgi:hypothetical protein